MNLYERADSFILDYVVHTWPKSIDLLGCLSRRSQNTLNYLPQERDLA